MWSLMTDVCREMGVRTDVPFRDLTEAEKEIVYHGPAVKKHIFYQAKNSNDAAELDFTYFNAVYTVENALSKVKDEKGMKRVEKFLQEDICPDCGGTRLSEAARAPRLRGIGLDEACKMTLSDLADWVDGVPGSLPEEMRPMAESICDSFRTAARRLMELGLGYLTLDRAASTLSTGERQRMQLARSVRNRTTGVLYVLDEPSIGLHPSNIDGLTAVMHDLVADGNSVLLVDHDTQILSEADWIVEMGPEAGAGGGQVIAQGTVADRRLTSRTPRSAHSSPARPRRWSGRALRRSSCLTRGSIHLSTGADPHGQAAGGGHPQGEAHRRHRCIRLGQDHSGAGEPDPRAWRPPPRGDAAARACPCSGGPGHRAGQAHRRHPHRHQCALHGGHLCRCPRRAAQDLRPIPRRQGRRATRRATSPTTPAACAARSATAPGSSAWMCSSCPMWRFPARNAGVPAMPGKLTGCATPPRTDRATPCPS